MAKKKETMQLIEERIQKRTEMNKRDRKLLEAMKMEEAVALGKLMTDVFGVIMPRKPDGSLDRVKVQAILRKVRGELESSLLPKNEAQASNLVEERSEPYGEEGGVRREDGQGTGLI